MNTASLELSKELYELCLWIDSKAGWHRVGDEYLYPKYTAGYLLRKVLEHTTIQLISQSDSGMLLLYYPEPLEEAYLSADTPEDALCKLAIELFKQGLLPMKEQS